MGWCPKIAGKARTIPAHRRPDRSLGIWRHRVGVQETPCSDLRMTQRANKVPGEAAIRTRTPNDHREIKEAELMTALSEADGAPAVSELLIGGSSEPPAEDADLGLYI
ncbi:hypothetical protein T07_15225 [Trichinella nelsoni]|uniref:Uncharacterized protein n=1 Tax=Trichinella nelsoni TaxID=6336 RepID=A0A0V0RIA0_9BILA|nr:hypothetical protein T07_15225 [Trichinella nelsoni]